MIKNNYLKNSIIVLLFAIPFVGLIVSNSLFFPFITGKNLMFRVLVELALVFYVLLAVKEPQYRPKINTLSISFALFLGIIFVADVFGVYPFKSFWSNFERMEGFVTHIHLFAYFIMLSAVFVGEKLWTRFFQTSLAVSIIIGLIGFNPERITSGRIFSQLGNSSYLGIYMLFHIFIAGFLLVRLIERKGEGAYKWMMGCAYGAVIIFDFYIFYNTGTRGALLGLLAGALFTSAAFAIWEKNKGLKILGVSVLASIVIAVSFLAGFKESELVKNNPLLSRFAALATLDRAEIANFTTTQGKSRFGIWNIAYEGFKERPMLGWGQDNFNYVFNKYYDPKIYDQEQWFDRAHNVFFDWLIAGGILGLLSYLALFVTAIVAIWRSRANEKDLYFLFSDKVLLTALLIAYFIHNLFVFDSLTSYILFFGVLAFISIHDRKTFSFEPFYRKISNEKYLTALSVVVIIAGGYSLYYFSFAPYSASKNLIKALSYQEYGRSKGSEPAYNTALDHYKKALDHDNVTGISEAREQLLQGTGGVLSSGVSNDIMNTYFTLVQDEFEKQFKSPDDTRYHLYYGLFLNKIGRAASSTEIADDGLSHLLKAETLSPNKQSVLYEIGSAYINNKEYSEAVSYFNKAYQLETSNNEARFLYALSLIYSGDSKTLGEMLEYFKGTQYLGDMRLIRVYYELKQYDNLRSTLLYKVNYAKVIAKNGNKNLALKEVQDALAIMPTLKTEGDKVIAEIKAMK